MSEEPEFFRLYSSAIDFWLLSFEEEGKGNVTSSWVRLKERAKIFSNVSDSACDQMRRRLFSDLEKVPATFAEWIEQDPTRAAAAQ